MKNKVRAIVASIALTAGLVMVPAAAQAVPPLTTSRHHAVHHLPAWLCFVDNLFRSGPERIPC